MKISKVRIKNYRSIKDIEFNFDEILALVGPNNAGKSNILEAIGFFLNSTEKAEQDFYHNQKIGDGIKITITFTNIEDQVKEAIKKYIVNDTITITKYAIQENEKESIKYYCGEICEKSNSIDAKILKEVFPEVIKIKAVEKVSDIIKLTSPTIMREIFKYMLNPNRTALKNELNEILITLKDKLKSSPEYEEIIRSLNDNIDLKTNIEIGFTTPEIDKIFTVNMSAKDNNIDVESVGNGLQRNIIMAMLKTYVDPVLQYNLPEKQTIFLVEEPEIYMHPKAQRAMYDMLKNISEKRQVIYTTHSNHVIDVLKHKNILSVKKPGGETQVKSSRRISLTDRTVYFIRNNQDRYNKGLFASKIIIVEGESEETGFQIFMERLCPTFSSLNIEIMSAGGISSIKNILEFYSSFGINCYVVFDGDEHNKKACKKFRNELLKEFGFEGKFDEIASISQKKFTVLRNDYEDMVESSNKTDYKKYEKEANKNDMSGKSRKAGFIAQKIDTPKIIIEILEKVKNMPEDESA